MTKSLAILFAALAATTAMHASAQARYSATLNEASLATRLSQQVGLLQFCGAATGLDPIPGNLDAFEHAHRGGSGRPLSNDMRLAVEMNTAAFLSKHGGKAKVCDVVGKNQAIAIKGVQQGWANLQTAHAAAKHS